MGHLDFPFLSIDREYERAAEADEAFDAAVASATRFNAASLRNKARNGDTEVLDSLVDEVAFRYSADGVAAQIIRTALTMGPSAAGQLLDNLIAKSVEALAEIAGIKEVENRSKEPA